jgi:DNA-binding transcriptional ArsR family regulator
MKRKLSPEQIAEIIKLYSEGVTAKELAIRYGVKQPTISYHVNTTTKPKALQLSNKRYKNLSIEEKKARSKKHAEYLKKYMYNRYHNDEEFRKRMIAYQYKNKDKLTDKNLDKKLD